MTEQGDPMDLELAAASLRADSSDVRILVKVLADQLADALGSRLEVKRAGGLLRKSEEVRSLRISLGDDQFDTQVDGESLQCSIGHSSGGIRIRSEKVGVDEWLARLLAGLQDEAGRSQSVRRALESIVIGGTS
ncbi:MAG: hypothetical protein ACLQPH_15210 [Acidimicrobiales bacterium]